MVKRDADRQVLFRLFTELVQDDLSRFTVKKAFANAIEMARLIERRTNGVHTCKIFFDKGDDGVDTAKMNFKPIKSKHHLVSPVFGYY